MTTRAQAPGRGDARPQPGSDPVRNPAGSGTKPCGGCDSLADRPGGGRGWAAGSAACRPASGSPRCAAREHCASCLRASAAAHAHPENGAAGQHHGDCEACQPTGARSKATATDRAIGWQHRLAWRRVSLRNVHVVHGGEPSRQIWDLSR